MFPSLSNKRLAIRPFENRICSRIEDLHADQITLKFPSVLVEDVAIKSSSNSRKLLRSRLVLLSFFCTASVKENLKRLNGNKIIKHWNTI